jgi:phosphate-selective porin OprO/OprP
MDLRRVLMATAALSLALGMSERAWADPAEDARIARLEAAVAELQAQVQAQAEAAQENVELKREVGDLRGQLAELKQHPVTVAATKLAPDMVKASLKDGHLAVATDDKRFSLNLYGLLQLDTGANFQSSPAPILSDLRRSGPALGSSASNVDFTHARQIKDGVDFRRARIGVYGNAFGDFQYRLLFDFGGAGVENAGFLYEGWAQYSGLNPIKVRVGAFSPLYGLADQDSTAAQPLLERPASADTARNLAAGDSRIAAQVFAVNDRWLASVAVTGRTVGQLNSGTASPTPQTYGDPLAFVGRAAGTPLEGPDWRVHLGAHGTWVDHPANTTGPSAATGVSGGGVAAFSDQAELRVDATRLINTGNIDARHVDSEGAEFAAQWRGLLLQSEYDHFHVQRLASGVTDPHFDGWYVEGDWMITGESRRYNKETAAFDGPAINHPVGDGGWGAVELALRYSDMDLNYDPGVLGSAPSRDTIRGGRLEIWTAGLNWYVNSLVRIAVEGQHVRLERLSPDATVYVTPIGAQIGQTYDTIAVRTQLAF